MELENEEDLNVEEESGNISEEEIKYDNGNNNKFYFINEGLKDKLTTKQSNFSLLKIFDGTANKSVSPEKRRENFNRINDPHEDNRIDNINNITVDEDVTQVWKNNEPLFFKPNDERFKSAFEFISKVDDEYAENFPNIRKYIKAIVRQKIKKINLRSSERDSVRVERKGKKSLKMGRKRRR